MLINRACPVRELTPLAGQPDLAAQAALTALLTPGARVLLTGGEETGAWLRKYDAASEVGYAFALELGDGPREQAVGELCWDGAPDPASAAAALVPGDLPALFEAVRARQPLRCATPAGGEISLHWF